MLTILEHTSSSYAPRTYVNAAKGDVTIAIAVDYSTAGEKLTHKAAGGKYIALPLEMPWIENARELFKFIRPRAARKINVAGNGIYTLAKDGVTQEEINLYVYRILSKVHEHFYLTEIRSGGQTGVDIAGAVAGVALGVDVELLLPKGFKQRAEDGVDREHTEEQIREQVMGWVEKLREVV